ncbi:hypothetical protein JCM6882_000826 [Rhodosporidiobolus microsporus]
MLHSPPETLANLKHALTRAHGRACPYHSRPQAVPAARVLVETLRGISSGKGFAPHVASVGLGMRAAHGGRTAEGVVAALRTAGARPFSSSALQGARVRGDGWDAPRSHAASQSQSWGWKQPGAQDGGETCPIRRMFGQVRGGFGRGERSGERMPWGTGKMFWKGSEEQKWPQWPSWSSAKWSSTQKQPPLPNPQDFSTRTAPSPTHSGPCHPYHLARTSASRAQWEHLTREPLEWMAKRYRPRPENWITSTNSHAYGDGAAHNHGFGHSHRGREVEPDHEHGEWVDVAPDSSSAPDYAHSHPHSRRRRRGHPRPSSSGFSTSNHSDSSHSPPPPRGEEDNCTRNAHWLFAIPANERRRRDPQKKRHFKHMMRTMGTPREFWEAFAEQQRAQGFDGGFGRGGGGGGAGGGGKGMRKWECAKAKWRAHECFRKGDAQKVFQRCQNEFLQRKAAAVLRFRHAARRSGASSRSSSSHPSHDGPHPHQHQHRSGPFNYEAFRESIWYTRMHYRHAARFINHRADSAFRPRFRHVAPEGWVRWSHARMRSKVGFTYFTGKYSNPRCGAGRTDVPLERGLRGSNVDAGAWGGSRVALGKPPAKGERPGVGEVAPCHLYRNELTARLASSAAARMGGASLLASASAAAASRTGHALRAFSSSAARSSPSLLASAPQVLSPLHLSLPFLLPLAAVLKSTAALNCLTILTRLSLTLLPLSLRGKLWHAFKARYAADPKSVMNSAIGRAWVDKCGHNLATESGSLARWNAAVGLPLLLAAPFVLLGLVTLASLERTPVTGRWRVVMLSPAEEAELVDGILAPPPAAATNAVPEGTSRDWVSILRGVLSLPNEGVSPSTGRRILLGGEVLDQRDWRVRWAEAVLRALEKGGEVALVGDAAGAGGGVGAGVAGVMHPPPTAYPLEPRLEHAGAWRDELMLGKHLSPASSSPSSSSSTGAPPLRVEYDLLVVDRPDANAFSFGFGPDRAGGGGDGARRGVVVVYTGFLDEILGNAADASLPPSPLASPPSPSRSSLFSPSPPPPSPAPSNPDPIAANLVPPVLPTQAQTKALAVLLSHELAHLCLDHTLEAYASTGLVVPHLMRLGSDVLRTVLYPLTFFLGPFLNDALGRTLHEGALGGFGVIGQAVNSCESRKLESEADRVALRLLAGSGIDPNYALEFWEDRLASAAHSPSSSSPSSPAHSHSHSPLPTLPGIRQHSHDPSSTTRENTHALDGLLRSHPVDEERVVVIKQELEGWRRWWESHGGVPVAAAAA